ncbi:MAG: hypothetical protein JWN04_2327 [Myxococcaceae bacterium]|nr:hypothetical protein [Myxococcaceae bacterium]
MRVAGRGIAAREHTSTHASRTWLGRAVRVSPRRPLRQVVRGALPLVLLGAVTASCSPAAFAVRERAAERALAAAGAEGAQGSATYEFVLAQLYLDKAREESAEAHYAWGLELLAKSEQSATRARTLSQERARSRVPTSPERAR